MRSDRIGYAYIKDAKTIAEEARESLNKRHYHRTVRKCQEAVELGLKGLLRFVGIEYPKSRRVGAVLLESSLKDAVPMDVLKRVAELSDELAREREPAFYGTEEGTAEELFTESDAREAMGMVEYVFDFIEKLLKEHGLIKPGDFQ
ncbi:MAG: HEPN domain-containing protein [Candidatus Loosdrechtia sp.]|uniref:HEPN domain-containing protein n=1 Tax=Candidatus Loosdrechtia sp. TaxID=3101272 RepID=UPI003A6C8F4D|nr:MAG: HEPN domain-containing protein [Candidatus Jettenia sp. AMX2]